MPHVATAHHWHTAGPVTAAQSRGPHTRQLARQGVSCDTCVRVRVGGCLGVSAALHSVSGGGVEQGAAVQREHTEFRGRMRAARKSRFHGKATPLDKNRRLPAESEQERTCPWRHRRSGAHPRPSAHSTHTAHTTHLCGASEGLCGAQRHNAGAHRHRDGHSHSAARDSCGGAPYCRPHGAAVAQNFAKLSVSGAPCHDPHAHTGECSPKGGGWAGKRGLRQRRKCLNGFGPKDV